MSDSAKVQKIIDELKELSLMEASELVKAIEETFDVSATAAVAAAPVAAAGDAGAAGGAEEKSEYTVKVTGFDDSKKIAVIKAVKTAMGVGLGEAKGKVEEGEFVVAENAKKEDAEKMKDELAAAGATVELV